jgi:hypothetical protein
MDVKFWHVGRDANTEADKLANEALDGRVVRGHSASGAIDYWNRIAPTIPAARSLASRLHIDIPNPDTIGIKTTLMYPVRRLVIAGQDTPSNLRLLLGPTWEEDAKHIWESSRLQALCGSSVEAPEFIAKLKVDDNRVPLAPRPPSAQEREKMKEYKAMFAPSKSSAR